VCLQHNHLSVCCFAILNAVMAFMYVKRGHRSISRLFLVLKMRMKRTKITFSSYACFNLYKNITNETGSKYKSSGMLHRVIICVSKKRNASIFNVKHSNKTLPGVLNLDVRFTNILSFQREESPFCAA
jgi:hypothetical protein